jgi:hypothetical protein
VDPLHKTGVLIFLFGGERYKMDLNFSKNFQAHHLYFYFVITRDFDQNRSRAQKQRKPEELAKRNNICGL